MDCCSVCHNTLTSEYFRVGALMMCANCVDNMRLTSDRNRMPDIRRGLLYSGVAAVFSCILLVGAYSLAAFASDSPYSFGAIIRGATLLLVGGMIGSATARGVRKTHSPLVQVGAVIFVYLAYSMMLPVVAYLNLPASKRSAALLVKLLALGPKLPFVLPMHNPLALSGLIVLMIACITAWRAAAVEEVSVYGPFSVENSSSS
jgi:hypothetical protein